MKTRNVVFDDSIQKIELNKNTRNLIELLAKSNLPTEGNFELHDFVRHDNGQISFLCTEDTPRKPTYPKFLTASQMLTVESYKENRKKIKYKRQNKWFYYGNEDPLGVDWLAIAQWDNGLPLTCFDFDEEIIEQNICTGEFRARCGRRQEEWFEISAELADKWIKEIKYRNGD